jgi:hypothetical protein
MTLLGDPEIGALQISAYFKDEQVETADLLDFAADHLERGAKPRDVEVGDFVGFVIALRHGEHYCRHWYLRNREQMLFVTYTCPYGDRRVESKLIGDIVASLRAEGDAVA